MKLYKNSLRNLLFEELVGFHGFGMKRDDLKVVDLCDLPAFDFDKSPDARGCPQFTNEAQVSESDIVDGTEYLNSIKPTEIIAYSRGASVLVHCLGNQDLEHIPEKIYFVAPAWKRWGSDYDSSIMTSNIKKATCRVVIGCCDAKVPVSDAKELSEIAGCQLEILLGYDHTLGKDMYKGSSAYFSEANPKDIQEEDKLRLLDVIKSHGIGSTKKDSPARVKSGALGFIWDNMKGDTVVFAGGELPRWESKSYATPDQLIQQIEACHGKAQSNESKYYKKSLIRAIFN